MSATNRVLSQDGTMISYLSLGQGPSVVVVPGVLSMATDYASFARALAESSLTVHVIERRGRGESGPQGNDYSIVKECEDVLAVQRETGASLLVGHSYGGLVALEAARKNEALRKVAIYEPGVSIDGSMGAGRMPTFRKKLTEGRNLDALVHYALSVAPRRMRKMPTGLLKQLLRVDFIRYPDHRQMLGLLQQLEREWGEIGRLDNSYESYREVAADVLFLYGGRSDCPAVDLQLERLPAVLPKWRTKEFPSLDHFGIERTAPREVAAAVGDFFLS